MRIAALIAYVCWTKVSDRTVQRYLEAPNHQTSSDWRSSDQIWIVDLLISFGGVAEMLKEPRETFFAGQARHQLMPEAQGKAKSLTWEALDTRH